MNPTPIWFQYPTFKWKKKHAVIIGGGIAGSQIAWHLCQSNWQVTLIERHDTLATEASGNLAGVISPKMTAKESIGEDFYTQSYHYTLSQLATLKQQGHSIEMDNCGVLQLAHNQREQKRWQALKNRKLPTDFIQLLDEKDTLKIAGINFHSEQQYKSCYFPKGGWIQPASFCKALVDHPNCKIIYNSNILKLKKVYKQWHVYNKNQELICQSEVVIIANGKDLFSFEQSSFLPGVPVAGQTTSSPASAMSKKLRTVVGHEGYLTPAISFDKHSPNETHIFGATFERNNSKPRISSKSDDKNLNSLNQYLPEFVKSLREVKSAHIAVRMTTPDRFPYVGVLADTCAYQKNYHDLHQGRKWKQYPQAEYQNGLFVLGGLGSRGVITSGYCAKALSELIANKIESNKSIQLLSNCHPARFIIKALKRNQNL